MCALGLALQLTQTSCSRTRSRSPQPGFASSVESQQAFAQIRESWNRLAREGTKERLSETRTLLDLFLKRFPKDGLSPLAHALAAVVAIDAGDLRSASAHLRSADELAPGTARDLATVARAKFLRIQGRFSEAMDLLRPINGKMVDPIARALLQEELVRAALSLRSEFEAISYMDAWLRGANEDDRESTSAKVTALVRAMPRDVLERYLLTTRASRGSYGYGMDIQRIVAQRLAEIAVEQGDAELARQLLDPASGTGTLATATDAGPALGELATSRRGVNIVEGRTIGLLLPTESPALRDESADVLRGVMWALGLPRGVRTILPPSKPGKAADPKEAKSASASASGTARPSRLDCPHNPPDPNLIGDEPRPEDDVRLVTRDDSGDGGGTITALEELAGQGASIILAALDESTADRAIKWSRENGIALLSLAPSYRMRAGGFAFVMGEDRGGVLSALVEKVPQLSASPIIPVADTSELPLFPGDGGMIGPLSLTRPVSCDAPTGRAGDPRFPISEWDHAGVRGWLVTGSATCTRDLLEELTTKDRRGIVALTLEAATQVSHTRNVKVLSASAGQIPLGTVDPDDEELRRFIAAFGPKLTWWSALGRDAATLARLAVRILPLNVATQPDEMKRRRQQVRDRLLSVRANLWTTEHHGLSSQQALPRTVCVLDISSR